MLCDDNDCIASKGYIVELHDYQDGTLAIITTHLQANNTDDAGQGQEIRTEQFSLLAEEIDGLRASGVEYIVVRGDFNVSLDPYNGEEVAIDRFIEATGLSQVCAEIECDDWETIRDAANASNSSTSDDLVWGNYDHFFYTAETLEPFDHQFHVPQDEEGRNIGDHLPRQASFRPI